MAHSSDDGAPPPYSDYLLEIYQNGMIHGKLPEVTTNPNLLEAHAKKAMKPVAFNYILGGAGEGSTMDANRLAFRQWKLIPRYLRPTLPRDLSVELFGVKYGMLLGACLPGLENSKANSFFPRLSGRHGPNWRPRHLPR